MRTLCAFHQGQYITQFCRCLSCLLPLCQLCIPIHRKQHSNLPQPLNLVSIDNIVQEVTHSIGSQFKFVETISIQTINKYRESEDQHQRLFQQIVHHKEILINDIHRIYQNILHELENNAKRRDSWINQFNLSVLDLKDQLISLSNAITGQKYLRAVIMWNRMKPNQTIQQVTKKAQKQWLIPSFIGCNHQMIANLITNNTKLKVLQIQGDSGIKKILYMIRVLRYGQQQATVRNSITSSLPPKPSNNNHYHLINFHTSSITIPPPPPPPTAPQNISINPIQKQNQIPIYHSPTNKKNSIKKLQVLSNRQQFKIHSVNQQK